MTPCAASFPARPTFAPDADGFDSIVVGHLMADELNIHTGDYVTLTSPEGRLTPYGMVPRSRRFRVAGVFDSGFYDYDANWVFATLPATQNLAGVGDVASVLEFRIRMWTAPLDAARTIGAAAGPGLVTTTWEDENRALFRALQPGKTRHRAVHRPDHVRRRTEYPGGAGHDGHRPRARYRRADVARRVPPSEFAIFLCCKDSRSE